MAGKSNVITGSYVERKDGRLEYRIYLGKDNLGKRCYKSVYGKNKSEIRKKIKEVDIDPIKQLDNVEGVLFKDFALNWMRTYKKPKLKPVSYDRLEQTYNRVCEEFGYSQTGSITTDELQEFINLLAKNKAYSTVKKHYEFLKNVFEHAVKTNKLDFNPCLAVELPKERNMPVKTKKVEILTQEETEAIYKFNETLRQSTNQFFKHVPVLLIMLNTGIRVGEMLALEWSDIDFNKKKMVINKTLTRAKSRDEAGNVIGKTKETFSSSTKTTSSERVIPINDVTIELLMQIKEYNKRNKIETLYVASAAGGGYVSERNLLRTFSSVLGVIGAPHYAIHSLRHTYASRLLKAGIHVSVVSKLLGHADINTTYKTYIHVVDGQMDEAIDLMPRV